MHYPSESPFFHIAFHEAFDLLVETRDYVEHVRRTGGMGEKSVDLLEFAYKSSRLTAQLAGVMNWLLAQRAAGEGVLTLDEALSVDYAMTGADEFRRTVEGGVGETPAALMNLVGRGDSLYNRVDRLEKEVRAKLS